jgi:hypothetical protein
MLLSAFLRLAGLTGSRPTGHKPSTPPTPRAVGGISLKAARALGPGATVTVRTVVLNGPELSGLHFVQDAESGLALYSVSSRVKGFEDLRAGDSIQATDQLKNY